MFKTCSGNDAAAKHTIERASSVKKIQFAELEEEEPINRKRVHVGGPVEELDDDAPGETPCKKRRVEEDRVAKSPKEEASMCKQQ